jgi:altronate hydrolase
MSTPTMNARLIQLHPNDNVWIAKDALSIGQMGQAQQVGQNEEATVRVRAQVPAGHKIAARVIAQGETVFKYNTAIGIAARDILPGEHVHGHNLAMGDFAQDPAFGADVRPVDYLPASEQAQFMGYVRSTGGNEHSLAARVGTRNFIGLFSSVNCSATVIHKIAAHFTPERLAARTSTASPPSPKPPAAAWPHPARTLTCCAAPSPATPVTPTSAAHWSSAWVVSATRSIN